ncbi:hypothetical protein ASPZODRAFT_155466 [Penicilliopsis zonata CBS 506.65]|uniref:trans-L-3-hydroxyproline dehydratase n=1 Tax=Penicilliopsis zonata CBS 506.65 TaxID=1073090 RepID=A0A1L9S4S0_9EURO|nr:hypothetical protein ASPZODRAFT_155466 [Penicilliopsis zonata CBS 506.65]OJJ42168.1 hypothetical protein ASPZODRAFT_155466 [Penicilliopsis zonata CBS 506.65]
MDIYERFRAGDAIQCIDMHTTGEPTRIILSGFPKVAGTLLEQREQYRAHHDRYRQAVMLEPRGHEGMYGALLVRDSELIATGAADIAVLYLHNEGYSTMCGHAALALGRFLVDTHDLAVFPRRDALPFDRDTLTTTVNLHTPCGINRLSVPTTPDGRSADPARLVSFLSVPSFAGALDLSVPIPAAARWPELAGRDAVTVDLSYGGAWYCMVDATELGFSTGLQPLQIAAFDRITRIVKAAIVDNPAVRAQIHVPHGMDLDFYLYGVMVVDAAHAAPVADVAGAETGLCFFADQQIDRSPTGGCVAARMALAAAKIRRPLRQRWAFHSLVSNPYGGAFVGSNVDEVDIPGGHGLSARGVVVQVEGQGYYTGAATFVTEPADPLTTGFSLKELESAS